MTSRVKCPACDGSGNYFGSDVSGMMGIGCGECMGNGFFADRRKNQLASVDAKRACMVPLRLVVSPNEMRALAAFVVKHGDLNSNAVPLTAIMLHQRADALDAAIKEAK